MRLFYSVETLSIVHCRLISYVINQVVNYMHKCHSSTIYLKNTIS